MTETKDSADKTKPAGERNKLTLQRTVESGHVRQNFSHGRSKAVVVEKKKSRKIAAPGPVAAEEPRAQQPRVHQQQRPTGSGPRPPQGGATARGLSKEESDKRQVALDAARRARDQHEADELRRREEAVALASTVPQPGDEAAVAPPVEAAVVPDTALPEAAAAQPQADSDPQPAAEAIPPAAVATPTVRSASPQPAAPRERAGAPDPRPPQRPESRGPDGRSNDARGPRPDGDRARGPGPGARPFEARRDGGRDADRRGPPRDRPAEGARDRAGDAAPRDGQSGFGPRDPQGAGAGPGQPRRSYDTAFRPREGGRPKEILIPRPPRPQEVEAKPEVSKITRDRTARPPTAPVPDVAEDDDARGKGLKGKGSARAPGGGGRAAEDRRERGKLTLDKLLNNEQRERSIASLKRKREREKLKALGIAQPREKIVREVIIPEVITIQELSNRMAERGVDLIRFMMKQGAMHTINDVIDADTAELLVTEFGHTPKRVSEADVEEGFIGKIDGAEEMVPRAPVVTIMGHVDHGKTSLLDAIRSANVVAGEAGGITQHIGAYQVETEDGHPITFIDTPGHEAFTAMRARGAKVTDIVVLVVAADDGVMPQTVEAINHAKAAGVPMIVAINKIDKPQADPSRVRTELLQHEIVVESMSGETLEVEVSALKRIGLDKLLDAILLQSEILDLRANADRSAEGIVVEAKLERGRGPVGTVLVQRGSLAVGDIVVAGTSWGRVRALIDDKGKNVVRAGPSVPVEVLGFDSAPEAGDQFAVVENEARAREITDYRVRKRREKLGSAGTPRTLEQMMQSLKDDAGKKEFTLLVKGDVQGSVEAIAGALKKISTDEVEARIIHAGVGGITESDIALANASNAVVFGFNVRANAQAKQAADQSGVEIRYYSIIYDMVDDVKAAMSGLLDPTLREIFLGNAQILQVFNITKFGKVAGCRVTDGKVERGAKVRLLRDNVVIHEGSLSILKRFKDDVKEVPAGQECGMSFANYQDIREGDVIECFQIEKVVRTL
ncbi:MAG: translation initiation factor IF-2 [Hyphomicrobiaceae bacterium]|nr:translation initiation factor IF-2 [Hyphomicrobiaceae bacterium]